MEKKGEAPAGRPDAPRASGETAVRLPKVEMLVTTPGACGILTAGGKMTYGHPEVLKEESDRICGRALVALVPVAERMARAAAAGREVAPEEITCPADGCGAVFRLRVLAHWEVQPPSPARGVPAADDRSVTKRFVRPGPPVGSGPFLSRLEPELVQEIVDACTVERYDRPTVFIREGQEGKALYIVGEGEVEVLRRSEGSEQEVVLAVLGKGECLGEMSLLSGTPATATVRTRGEGTAVLVLSKEALEDLLDRRRALHREFSKIIAERLYRMNTALEAEKGRGISGHLSMIGIADLIQTLHASRRTGTLLVRTESGAEAKVGFRNGEVSSALTNGRPGADGFYELLAWREGEFEFQGGEPELDSTPGAAVTGNTMSLLMEGLRRLDEKGRAT